MLRARLPVLANVAFRRNFAAGSGDAVQELFANEFKSLGERLKAEANVEKEVPADVFKAMEEEVTAAKTRTGLANIGDLGGMLESVWRVQCAAGLMFSPLVTEVLKSMKE